MRKPAAAAVLALMLLGPETPAASAAAPIANTFKVSVNVAALTIGNSYLFTFSLYDAAANGSLLFSEKKSYRVPANRTISHLLGSVNRTQPMRSADFLQQLWVQVSTGTRVFPRIKLNPAPHAIGAENADLLDGQHAADFAPTDHTHGGAGSGLDADLLDGQHGAFYQDAGNLNAGTLGDGRLSGNVCLLGADQTVSGLTTFDPAAAPGTPPFAVGAARTGTVANLSADLLDGQHGSFFRDAGNLDAGSLATDRYSAYADLAAEGYLGNAAGNVALNNGTLQATLYAQRAQTADTAAAATTAATASALSASALASLDRRYGLATTTQGLTGYPTRAAADELGLYMAVTIGADGLPVVAYHAAMTGASLKVLHCGDAACSAGNTYSTVDNAGTVGLYSSITVGADGLPVISYYDSDGQDLKVAHCGDLACSTGTTVTTVDSTGDVGQHSSIAIGADGLPVVSYFDATNARLRVLRCGSADCTSGNAVAEPDPAAAGNASSITIGADGLPLVAYRSDTAALSLLHCGDAACTTGTSVTSADAGAVAWDLSATIGADGLPVVSYSSFAGNLKVLRCGNAACTSGNSAVVADPAASVGAANSIAVGTDGLPVISYHDTAQSLVKVLHCGDPGCASGNSITVVGGTGGATAYSSITVGADGMPVLAYYNHTGQRLTVARILYKPAGRR